MNRNYSQGFTLIELLVVISLIGLLSSIIIAALGTARTKAVVGAGQIFDGHLYQAFGAQAVAIWNFDEGSSLATTTADSSGNRNNLAISSSAKIETTKVFRGKSAFQIVTTSGPDPATTTLASFNPSNGSISFWLNLTQPSSQAGIFCSRAYFEFCLVDSTANVNGMFLQINWTDQTASVQQLETTIPANSMVNKWSNVAVSWNATAGSIILYINGAEIVSSAYSPAVLSQLGFCVGGDCRGSNLNGYLDEFRVYSQSLQTAEIEKLYAEGLPKHVLADVRL